MTRAKGASDCTNTRRWCTHVHTLQVALARILQGFGEAGCTPFATAIIADYFPKAVLGTAISFYNIGIYTGERGGNRAVCMLCGHSKGC